MSLKTILAVPPNVDTLYIRFKFISLEASFMTYGLFRSIFSFQILGKFSLFVTDFQFDSIWS